MLQDGYPSEALRRWAFGLVEERVFLHAARVLVTTPGTAELYEARYKDRMRAPINIVPNGFDEELFVGVLHHVSASKSTPAGPITVVHSGVLYPTERNPAAFFRAVSELKKEGELRARQIVFVLRGCRNEAEYERQISALDLSDLVEVKPTTSYREAVAEMQAADGVMVFQASNCNMQIPAKVYEYLYAGKPMIGLTDPAGDTGRLLNGLGVRHVAPLEDKDAIKAALRDFVRELREDAIEVPSRDDVLKFSRRNAAIQLATILDEVVAERAAKSPAR
jgi:glycosyltransferase involved in cell wall biosynthesis